MGTDLDTVCAEIYPLYIQHITSLVEYLVGQGVLQLSQLTPDALDTLSGEQDYLSSRIFMLLGCSSGQPRETKTVRYDIVPNLLLQWPHSVLLEKKALLLFRQGGKPAD